MAFLFLSWSLPLCPLGADSSGTNDRPGPQSLVCCALLRQRKVVLAPMLALELITGFPRRLGRDRSDRLGTPEISSTTAWGTLRACRTPLARRPPRGASHRRPRARSPRARAWARARAQDPHNSTGSCGQAGFRGLSRPADAVKLGDAEAQGDHSAAARTASIPTGLGSDSRCSRCATPRDSAAARGAAPARMLGRIRTLSAYVRAGRISNVPRSGHAGGPSIYTARSPFGRH